MSTAAAKLVDPAGEFANVGTESHRTELEIDDTIRLDVCDSGTGFDPAIAEKMFEAFHTTKANGMGIGLSICRSIIKSHKGHLWATPNDDPGATFSFSIPVATKLEPRLTSPAIAPSPTDRPDFASEGSKPGVNKTVSRPVLVSHVAIEPGAQNAVNSEIETACTRSSLE